MSFRRVLLVLPSALSTTAGLYSGTLQGQPFWFAVVVVLSVALLVIDLFVRDSKPLHRPDVYALLDGAHHALKLGPDVRMCIYRRSLVRPSIVYQFTPYVPLMRYGSGRRGFVDSKGIVGLCFRTGKVVSEYVEPGTDFDKRMVNKWGFTREETNKMDREQRCFVCVPVFGPDRKAIAVLYVACPNPAIQTPELEASLEEVAVRLAAMV